MYVKCNTEKIESDAYSHPANIHFIFLYDQYFLLMALLS